jgi:aspartyl-tRNA(Asn)/glutamyl-tRNA(Gln) amidotransferase subunit C
MVAIDEALTRRVSHLARLELTESEVHAFTGQLREILGYVEQLNEVDVTGVAPLTHPLALETPLRDDVARPFPTDADGQPRTLGPAPETVDGGFKVPPIL